MPKREDNIRDIEGLYPPDSQYATTREEGRELLIQALCDTWRELPDAVLERLAYLNRQKEMSLR